MKRQILFLSIFAFTSTQIYAQGDTLTVNLDIPLTVTSLENSPKEVNVGVGQVAKSDQIIYLPTGTRELKEFKVIEYDILPESLRKEIKTFYGYMVDNPTVTCRLTLSNGQISALLNVNGKSITIEKNRESFSANAYWVYESVQTPQSCEVEREAKKSIDSPTTGNVINFNSHGTQLRTYRLALLVTNGFYTAAGGNDGAVNTFIATLINNINGIYEKEIAVRFTLVNPNNPASTNVFYNHGGATDLNTVHNEINNRYGNSNYDVGHILLPNGGGVAGLGVVCSSSQKGAGLSGVTSPTDILIFAHELGHQFDADHTFNGNGSGNCGPSNRGNNDAYEPGSGNTIMSYATICSPEFFNLIGGKVPYFHTRSQTTMISYITANGCGTVTNTSNNAPVVTLSNAVTMPRSTPFILTGSATDADGDALNYTWEQYDLAAVSDTGTVGNTPSASNVIAVNSTTAPLFRTSQSTSGTRSFPNLAYVLNDANNPPDQIGEDLPAVGRTMNFRLTARDNKAGGGGVAFKQITVTVNGGAGPLEINSFNAASTIAAGSNQTISWSVNNTNTISGNVKITLSVDGGQTFPYILLASTPNDGSQQVTIPANVVATSNGRIKVSSLHHPTAEFFDFNDAGITITSTCSAKSNSICPANAVTANQGDASLNLNIAGSYSNNLPNNTLNLDFGAAVNRTFLEDNGAGVCITSGGGGSLITPFQVNASGTYTISSQGNFYGIVVLNNATVSCSNYVGSNSTNGSFSSQLTVNLNVCTTYYLLVYDFFGDGNKPMTISGPGSVSQIITAPAGFSYTFAAINKATSQIAAVSATANFTNLGGGNYEVSGLAYANGVNVNSFVNQTTTQAYGNGSCILFSSNSKTMNIVGVPCPTSITLTNPTNNITSGVVKQETSGVLTATNAITGGNVKYDAGKHVLLSPGFSVNNGVVFSAYIDGCGGQ